MARRYYEPRGESPEEQTYRTMALGLSGLGTISRAMSQRKREEAARKRVESAEERRAAMAERQFGLQERQLEATLSERERVRKAQMYGMLDNLAQRLMEQRDENNKPRFTPEQAEARAREIMTERGYELGGIPSPAARVPRPIEELARAVPSEKEQRILRQFAELGEEPGLVARAGIPFQRGPRKGRMTPEEERELARQQRAGEGWWSRAKQYGLGVLAQPYYLAAKMTEPIGLEGGLVSPRTRRLAGALRPQLGRQELEEQEPQYWVGQPGVRPPRQRGITKKPDERRQRKGRETWAQRIGLTHLGEALRPVTEPIGLAHLGRALYPGYMRAEDVPHYVPQVPGVPPVTAEGLEFTYPMNAWLSEMRRR